MLRTKIEPYFSKRRERLFQNRKLKSAFVFPANPEVIRNGDVHYPYRQDTNFYYLSGFDEPNSYLVLVSDESLKKYKMILFVEPRDPLTELWSGERYGMDRAKAVFGADEAYAVHEFEERMPKILQSMDEIYYRLGVQLEQDQKMLRILEAVKKSYGRSGRGLLDIKDPSVDVGELRLMKSAEEMDLMRRVARYTAEAHLEAMKYAKPGMNEYEVEALVQYEFARRGCQRSGYGSIIASGANACCLHYTRNNAEMRDGDLLLIDAGGEFDYYGADITRTFPVGKKYSPHQADLYDLVLETQEKCIEAVKPGSDMTIIHDLACRNLIEGLLHLRLLKGDVDENLENKEYRRFYPHNTGHWLGMDVHDSGLYRLGDAPRKFEPGMIFTVEPGLYCQPTDSKCPETYRGIGIRIEDDVLVTESGCEVLTKDVPKDRSSIEAIASS